MTKMFKKVLLSLNNLKSVTKLKSQISLVKPKIKTLPHNIVTHYDITNSNSMIIKRLVNVLRVFEEVTGLDQVKHSRDNANILRNELDSLFQKRMTLSQQMFLFNNSLKDIHQKMDKTYKGEDLYYQYMDEERKILTEEKKIAQEFKMIEEKERFKFTQLTMAMKTSDDLVQTQQEKSRYLSIFYSIISGIFFFILGWFLNYKKYADLKTLIVEKPDDKQINDETKYHWNYLKEKLESLEISMKESKTKESITTTNEEEGSWNNLWNKPYVKYSVIGGLFVVTKFFGF